MSNLTTGSSIEDARDLSLQHTLRAGFLGGILAAIGNLIIYMIALVLFGDRLVVPGWSGGQVEPLSPINVGLYSLIPGIIAGLLLWVLKRFTAQPVGFMLGISISFLLFSFTAPLGLPSIPNETRVVLAVMHVVAATAILGILLRNTR